MGKFLQHRISSLTDYLTVALVFAIPFSVNINLAQDKWGVTLITEPLCVLISGLIALQLLQNFKNIPFTKLDAALAFYFGSIFVSSFFSWSLSISLKYSIITSLHFIASYFAFKLSNNKPWLLEKMTISYLAGHFLLVLYCLFQVAQLGIFYEKSYLIAQPFVNQGHSNLSIMLEAPALLALALLIKTKRSKTEQKLLALALLVFILTIAFSCSRTSYLSLSIAIVLMSAFLFELKQLKKVIFYVLVPLGVVVIAWKINNTIHEYRLANHTPNHYDSNDVSTYKKTDMLDELTNIHNTDNRAGKSSNERLVRWKKGFELWQQNTLTGIGPGTFADRYQAITKDEKDPFGQQLANRKMNSHNIYLSWLVEGGLLVALAGFSLLILLAIKGIQLLRNPSTSSIQKSIIFCFIPLLIHGTVQDYSNEPRISIVFWLGISVLSYFYYSNEQTAKVKSST